MTMDGSYYLVKHRLLEYLEKSKVPITELGDEDYSVVCPCCGNDAKILVIPLSEVQSSWKCDNCGAEGDAISFAREFFQFKNDIQALQDVCRKLNVPITVLDTVSAKDLLSKHYEPVPEIVQGLIGPGLYVLAGAPKIGKSWLVLDLAVSVSKGVPFWTHETLQSDVLYLSLEDSEERIQNRLRLVSNGDAGNIYFATDVEPIENGFEKQISSFLENNKKVKLVVVDTFGKARGSKTTKTGYAEDYALMTGIKRLAMRFNVAIILVHHTKKREEDDIMAMISGTNGIFGCADGGMVLHRPDRSSDEATLYTTGRDFDDCKFSLKLNKEIMRWQLHENHNKAEENEIIAAIVCYMRTKEYWEGTATDLLEELLTIDKWIVTKANGLARMLNSEKKNLRERYRIEYRRGREDNNKLIILINLKNERECIEEIDE